MTDQTQPAGLVGFALSVQPGPGGDADPRIVLHIAGDVMNVAVGMTPEGADEFERALTNGLIELRRELKRAKHGLVVAPAGALPKL